MNSLRNNVTSVGFNYWWKAKVVKADAFNVWYITCNGKGKCFNPLTKEWQSSIADENGVLVCCFANESQAKNCLAEHSPGFPKLKELPVATKFMFGGTLVMKSTMSTDFGIVCFDIKTGFAWSIDPNVGIEEIH